RARRSWPMDRSPPAGGASRMPARVTLRQSLGFEPTYGGEGEQDNDEETRAGQISSGRNNADTVAMACCPAADDGCPRSVWRLRPARGGSADVGRVTARLVHHLHRRRGRDRDVLDREEGRAPRVGRRQIRREDREPTTTSSACCPP